MNRLAAALAAFASLASLATGPTPATAQSPTNRIAPFGALFSYDATAKHVTAKKKVQVAGYQLDAGTTKSCEDLRAGGDDVCAWADQDLSVEENGPLTVVKGTAEGTAERTSD